MLEQYGLVNKTSSYNFSGEVWEDTKASTPTIYIIQKSGYIRKPAYINRDHLNKKPIWNMVGHIYAEFPANLPNYIEVGRKILELKLQVLNGTNRAEVSDEFWDLQVKSSFHYFIQYIFEEHPLPWKRIIEVLNSSGSYRSRIRGLLKIIPKNFKHDYQK